MPRGHAIRELCSPFKSPPLWAHSCCLGRPASLEHLADSVHNPLAIREDMIFEDGAIGYWHLQGADPLYRRLEPRERRRILGGNRRNLRRETGRRPRLVGDD